MKDKNQKPSIFSTPSIFSNNNPFFNQGMSLFNFQNAANIPPIKHSDQTQENE